MRRPLALTAIALTLALAGCSSTPHGTDGNLIDDWRAMPAASPVAPPAVGACHYFGSAGDFEATLPGLAIFQDPVEDETRDCLPADAAADTIVHDTETAYVGVFTGPDAAGAVPPTQGSAGRRNAYALCQIKVDEYLGGDWHQASVWISLVLPSDAAWHSGAHWYRCDVGRTQTPASFQPVMRGSVHGGLTGDHPLVLSCLITNENSAGEIVYSGSVACDKAHAAEYAGAYTAPAGDFPADDDTASDGCSEVVARYLGFPDAAAWDNDKIGLWALPFDEGRWYLGDRSTRCFAYAFTSSKVLIGSVRGLRTGTPRS
jgi:Septum formation